MSYVECVLQNECEQWPHLRNCREQKGEKITDANHLVSSINRLNFLLAKAEKRNGAGRKRGTFSQL